MNVELISVGTELLLGDITNTNARYLSQKMAELGFNVYYQTSVGDNPSRLKKAFKSAFERADIVLFTGGLGPTKDDLTKETIFQMLGLTPQLHQKSFESIKAYFQKMGKEPTVQNEKQAMFPKGATIFPNDVGTAPGCALESTDKIIVFLPGPPSEMKTMFETYVWDYLKKFTNDTIVSKTLKVTGIGESALEPLIESFLEKQNPTCAIYAKEAMVEIRITAKAETKEEAEQEIEKVATDLRVVLGDFLFSENKETLEEVVVNLLKEQNLKIATCESCTGGLLAAKLTEVAGASQIIDGGFITYANDKKEDFVHVSHEVLTTLGAVSREAAGQMAAGTLEETGADIAVSITGIAGPGGGSEEKPVGLVFIGLTDGKRMFVKELRLPDTGRDSIRSRTVVNALDMVRLYLKGKLTEAEDMPVRAFQKETQKKAPTKFDWKTVVLQLFLFVCFAAFIVSGWELGKGFYNSRKANKFANFTPLQLYEETVNENIVLPEGYQKQFGYLYAYNADIKGFLSAPGTEINQPVVQGEDNKYYTGLDYFRSKNTDGTVFFDYRANIKKPAQNTVIYGGNLASGSLLNEFNHYKDTTYFNDHKLIELNTVYQKIGFEPFAVLETGKIDSLDKEFDFINTTDFTKEEDFENFIKKAKEASLVKTDSEIEKNAQILTIVVPNPQAGGKITVLFSKRLDNKELAKRQETLKKEDKETEKKEDTKKTEKKEEDNKTVSLESKTKEEVKQEAEKVRDELPKETEGVNKGNGNGRENIATPPPPLEETVPKPTPSKPGNGGSSGGNSESTKPVTGTFTFTTYGYGHGVGMSQVGADFYAEQGWSYEKILKHYYSGVKIENKGISSGKTLSIDTNSGKKTGDIAYILAGVANAEMGMSYHKQALQAQAIATHSFLKDSNNTEWCPWKEPSKELIAICKEVENKVVTYNGNIVYTPYFAISSGKTQGAEDMWGESLPWLKGVDSSVCKNSVRYKKTFSVSSQELKVLVKDSYDITLSDNPYNWIKGVRKNSGGYVVSFNLDDKKTMHGEQLRRWVFGYDVMRSNAFDVTFKAN